MATASRGLRKAKRPVEGGLLAVTHGGIVGWAWDPTAPAKPLQVVLLANELVVGTGVSNRFDLKVVSARIGPGIPGFIINPSQTIPHSDPVNLTLRDATGNALGAPLILDRQFVDELGLCHYDEEYEGMVEGISGGILRGWVLSKSQTHRPVPVGLYDGTEKIVEQIADEYRGDLDAAGKRGGRCAFAFALPINLLDGRVHSLRVLIRGTDQELGGGPVQFGPLVTSKLVEEVVRLRQETRLLQSIVDKVISADGMIQSEIVRIMSDRVAAFADIQCDMIEKELDALRKVAFREYGSEPGLAIRSTEPQMRGTKERPSARRTRVTMKSLKQSAYAST